MHVFDNLVQSKHPELVPVVLDASLKDVLNDIGDVLNSVIEIVGHLVKASEDLWIDARIWRVESGLDLFRSLDLQLSSNQLDETVLHLQNTIFDFLFNNGQKLTYWCLVHNLVERVTKSFEEIFRKFFLIINVNKKTSYLLS